MNAYVLLFIAVIAEIVGTSALKASYGLSKLLPSLLVAGAYSLCFWTLSLTLKELPVSIVYAIWSGLGILGIALIGVVYYGENFGLWHFLGMLSIILGVFILSMITH
ncbi:MAG: multidrug efflux SMR transporter [Chlamydiales bacterium]|nr:multidrug efflux SMR transporter [Chlamydiales bacterium]